MKGTRRELTVVVVIFALTGASLATECVWGKQFKVRQVCGKVKDWQGAEVPNATVQLKRRGQSESFAEVRTASDGSFAVAEVPGGDYEIRVKLSGFWDASQGFRVDHPKKSTACSQPIRVVMKVAGQCSYVENAWKKKDLH